MQLTRALFPSNQDMLDHVDTSLQIVHALNQKQTVEEYWQTLGFQLIRAVLPTTYQDSLDEFESLLKKGDLLQWDELVPQYCFEMARAFLTSTENAKQVDEAQRRFIALLKTPTFEQAVPKWADKKIDSISRSTNYARFFKQALNNTAKGNEGVVASQKVSDFVMFS